MRNNCLSLRMAVWFVMEGFTINGSLSEHKTGTVTQILQWRARAGRGKRMCCNKSQMSAVTALAFEESIWYCPSIGWYFPWKAGLWGTGTRGRIWAKLILLEPCLPPRLKTDGPFQGLFVVFVALLCFVFFFFFSFICDIKSGTLIVKISPRPASSPWAQLSPSLLPVFSQESLLSWLMEKAYHTQGWQHTRC